MPKLDIDTIPQANRTGYPAPYDQAVAGRWWRRLGPLAGLNHMGASHVVLDPGAWSSQRHWHDDEDELVIMLTGHAVLIEGPEGEEPTRTSLSPGDICGWAAADRIAHHIVNETDAPCSFVAISAGNREGSGGYADIDMIFRSAGYFHKDGTPYATERLR
ncbi:cupin domain-containing protein [Novosphingobium rhizovicinum]|uniref:Cupin domain-containing protein n=1 Tax=Novosphingobium rhizovicinum TaxID=3228928 RepID=A0ABV3RDV9_9SPHN